RALLAAAEPHLCPHVRLLHLPGRAADGAGPGREPRHNHRRLPRRAADVHQRRAVFLRQDRPVHQRERPGRHAQCYPRRARRPDVMRGYWRKPEETAKTIVDGWLHTGDLARLDDDGWLYITGRKKELIVTASGKNIAPVLLELLLTEDPLIQQAMVVGDGRNYLAALIVVHEANLREELAR